MRRTPWFRHWFGDEYLALYPHRDTREARDAVELLRAAGGDELGERVLDLACGGGRHLAELVGHGFRSTGLDLSLPLLGAAREAAPEAFLVRGDMRILPFDSGAFDVVTSFFTSFAYFEDEYDDQRVLREVRRVLVGGGTFLLDFLNAHAVRENLKAEDRRMVGDVEVRQQRRLVADGRIVEKRITIAATAERPARAFVERVRLYEPRELDRMLMLARLEPGQRFGSYEQTAFEGSAPRYIVMGRAF
ncbi:MAG: class I SAM-dependent methyltransferase [Gemmatimonadetes bacterium]|nr:class I SAM-dependent methyltransferase [Gemmatimonadota bacterium]